MRWRPGPPTKPLLSAWYWRRQPGALFFCELRRVAIGGDGGLLERDMDAIDPFRALDPAAWGHHAPACPPPIGSSEGADDPLTIREIQAEYAPWNAHNFAGQSIERRGLLLGEECGEVQRAILKTAEGTRPDTRGSLGDELGDVFITLCSIADGADLDLATCVASRWDSVRRRDYKNAPPR